VVRAVTGGDLSNLVHTGLVPVQLQLPGTDPTSGQPAQATTNGAA